MLYRPCLLAIVPCAHPRLAAKARKETYITALRLHVIDFGLKSTIKSQDNCSVALWLVPRKGARFVLSLVIISDEPQGP
ncbi:hypothetical protein FOXB_07636 [Fusarium oxysporum f. sp. conglutinans Fo5176]|uniref:Uncharacterized protein n=1 Tax=Fusarium oxysporum (strain Fo5176) TaxID=660025 RepID=F9FMK6_FUSOF|nr:hypothetical protein FOXB_07636 [Fusarium oxysporum f. sp. conglutinans Fo5176]